MKTSMTFLTDAPGNHEDSKYTRADRLVLDLCVRWYTDLFILRAYLSFKESLLRYHVPVKQGGMIGKSMFA